MTGLIDSLRLTPLGNSPCVGCELGMIAVREISADRDRWRGEALAKRNLEEESKVKKLEVENKRLREEIERLRQGQLPQEAEEILHQMNKLKEMTKNRDYWKACCEELEAEKADSTANYYTINSGVPMVSGGPVSIHTNSTPETTGEE